MQVRHIAASMDNLKVYNLVHFLVWNNTFLSQDFV